MPFPTSRSELATGLLLAIALAGGSWWYFEGLWQGVEVLGAGEARANGYYLWSTAGGFYVQNKRTIGPRVPDVFALGWQRPQVDETSLLVFRDAKGRWGIGRPGRKAEFLYLAEEGAADGVVPPQSGWQPTKSAGGKRALPAPEVRVCGRQVRLPKPELGGGGRDGIRPKEGVTKLLQRPATGFLLGANLVAAYCIWSYKVSPEAVAISYSAFWEHKEYWRAVTASFSHFEAMHLAFNMMSLWNLGELERLMGSFGYFYLSLDLVVATIVLVILLQHWLVHRRGVEAQRDARAVGYSCVLFSFMVCAAVAQREFCPIPFFAQFCFSTYFIPMPFAGAKLPVNVAPFALLFLVQFIMPKAGFLGHLSGLILGYPLAWHMLDWLSTPLLVSVSAVAMLHHCQGWPWKLPDYRVLLQGWDGGDTARVRGAKELRCTLLLQGVSLGLSLWLFVLGRGVAEVLSLGVGWCALQALKCCCCMDSDPSEHAVCVSLLKASAACCAALGAGDLLTLGALLAKGSYVASAGVGASPVADARQALLLGTAAHLAGAGVAAANALHFRQGQIWLSSLGFSGAVRRHTMARAAMPNYQGGRSLGSGGVASGVLLGGQGQGLDGPASGSTGGGGGGPTMNSAAGAELHL